MLNWLTLRSLKHMSTCEACGGFVDDDEYDINGGVCDNCVDDSDYYESDSSSSVEPTRCWVRRKKVRGAK